MIKTAIILHHDLNILIISKYWASILFFVTPNHGQQKFSCRKRNENFLSLVAVSCTFFHHWSITLVMQGCKVVFGGLNSLKFEWSSNLMSGFYIFSSLSVWMPVLFHLACLTMFALVFSLRSFTLAFCLTSHHFKTSPTTDLSLFIHYGIMGLILTAQSKAEQYKVL